MFLIRIKLVNIAKVIIVELYLQQNIQIYYIYMNETVLEIIKNSLPAILIAITVYIMLDKQAKKEEKMKFFELKKKHSKESLPIILQAYERLTLLIHRISLENMIPRTQNASLNVKNYTFVLLKTIKTEFEHNITQQVYVSSKTWEAIQVYKNDIIAVIKEKSLEFDPESPSFNLAEALLNYVIENPNTFNNQELMDMLKKEVKQLFL